MRNLRHLDVSKEGAPKTDAGAVSIPWSWIGYGGLTVGVASLATLATVVTVKQVDTLSTIALVLAVLAFVIQIIVFIAQTAAANEQAVSVQAVNAETRAMLVEVRTNTQQTNDTLREQFNRVLDGVLASVESKVGDSADDPADPRSEVLGELEQAVEQARGAFEEALGNPSQAKHHNSIQAVRHDLSKLLATPDSHELFDRLVAKYLPHDPLNSEGIHLADGVELPGQSVLETAGLASVDRSSSPPQLKLSKLGRRYARDLSYWPKWY